MFFFGCLSKTKEIIFCFVSFLLFFFPFFSPPFCSFCPFFVADLSKKKYLFRSTKAWDNIQYRPLLFLFTTKVGTEAIVNRNKRTDHHYHQVLLPTQLLKVTPKVVYLSLLQERVLSLFVLLLYTNTEQKIAKTQKKKQRQTEFVKGEGKPVEDECVRSFFCKVRGGGRERVADFSRNIYFFFCFFLLGGVRRRFCCFCCECFSLFSFGVLPHPLRRERILFFYEKKKKKKGMPPLLFLPLSTFTLFVFLEVMRGQRKKRPVER